jgi:hypothetical protein
MIIFVIITFLLLFLVNTFVANFYDALLLYGRSLNETIQIAGRPSMVQTKQVVIFTIYLKSWLI